MKKKLLGVLLSAVMAASLAACGGGGTAQTAAVQKAETTAAAAETKAEETKAEETKAEETKAEAAASEKGGMEGGTALNFTTGGDQGTYYGFGGVLAGKVSETTSTTVTAITSGGSKANIEALEMGDAQLGFVQSDVMAYAYNGTRLFEGAPVTNISTVASLYMEQVQIVTLDENIKSVADLKGKNVSIGAAGSGVYFNAIDILGAYGLAEADINPTFESFADTANSIKDGKIDAGFVVAGAPTTAITELSTSKQAYLVALDKEHVDQLVAASPYYSAATIPAGTYSGIDEDIATVSVQAVILANDTVAEDDVYKLVADIFDNAASLVETHAKYGEIDLDKGASITTVPYHPGAAKYFGEKGKTVTTK